MQLTLTTAPTTDPVALAEVRKWLNFTDGIVEDDGVLETLIDWAYTHLENQTNRKYLGQTWTYTIDSAAISNVIRLPLVPLASVTSITTTDDDDADSVVTATNYQVRAGENPRIVLAPDGEWPTDEREYDSMAIVCVCGYGGDTVPHVGFQPADSDDPGLDDLSASGTFTGTARTTFQVKVTTAGGTDYFKYRKVTKDANGVKTFAAWSSATAMTGSAQLMADGMSVTFAETTEHTLDDQWNVQMYEVTNSEVAAIISELVLYKYNTKGQGITETVSGQLIGLPRNLQQRIDSLRVESW